MNIEIKGRIVGINETIVVSESFSKREFKVVTNETYPNTFKVQVTKDKCALLDNFKINDEVTVFCNLKTKSFKLKVTSEIEKDFVFITPSKSCIASVIGADGK